MARWALEDEWRIHIRMDGKGELIYENESGYKICSALDLYFSVLLTDALYSRIGRGRELP